MADDPPRPLGSSDTPANPEQRRLANLIPHQFKPGASGNPSGKSKKLGEFQALARDNSIAILRKLILIALRRSDAVAVRAAEIVLERAWGKAPQPVTGKGGGPIDLQFRGQARAVLEDAIASALEEEKPATPQPS